MDACTGDVERFVRRDAQAIRLDQSLGLDDQPAAVGGAAGDPDDSVSFFVRLEVPAEVLVDLDPLPDHVDAVLKMVEHLALGRQVAAVLAEGPLDVARREHRVGLVQAYVGVHIDPHAADACPTIDQDHLLIARQVSAGGEQGVEPGDAGSDDAHVAGFHG
ncbi:hypothetical protein MMAN_32970 [Mycobacterium mantenii]|uniref:Uncharacterized protein n=1 Tax=Mycobacterium mantenii TaxID=560555 RepID=A0ABM7JUC9_MYCNT|nr:hypothetical protein MMAN_32970 [Mycobacterium mantenii]